MKILWAVDPFSSETAVQEVAGRVIRAWTSRLKAEVEPVHVCTDPGDRIPPKLRAEYNRQLAVQAETFMKHWKSRLEIPTLLPLKVLGPVPGSLRDRVQCLLNYARESRAELIVSSTRGKHGITRWLMGSFAETLALSADLPLLFVNPSLDLKRDPALCLDTILFPTDFSEESHHAFRKLLPMAKGLGSRVRLFHQFRFGLIPMMDVTAVAAYIPQETWQNELDALADQGNRWAEEANQAGVPAEVSIDRTQIESVASSILDESEKIPGFIALSAQSNAIEIHLLGSVTRQVLRTSRNPVWILRAPSENQAT